MSTPSPHRPSRLSRYPRPTRHSTARAALAAVVMLVTGASLALAQSAEPRASLPDIEDEVMCPVCGTTLELASESPQAIREREFIRDLIAAGRTKEEVKDALVAEFGDEVLALPDDEGFDLAAWLVPGLAILGAAVAIFLGLRRWRARTPDAAPAGTVPSSEEAARLEADLERYGP